MATQIEQEYEDTIQLYLANDYQIVSQTDNSVIMISSEFHKYQRNTIQQTSNMQRMRTHNQGNNPNSDLSIIARNTTISGAYDMTNTAKSSFEVSIRITKTEKIDISGFTLAELNEYQEAMRLAYERFQKFMIIVIVILLVSSFVFFMWIMNIVPPM